MRKKFLSLLIIFVLLLIQFVPIVLAANDIEEKENNNTTNLVEENEKEKNVVNEKEETDKVKEEETNIEENKNEETKTDEIEPEETNIEEVKNDVEEEKETKKEDIKLDKQEEVLQTRSVESNNVEEVVLDQNEDFSIYIDISGNKINPYEKNGINYFFVPKSADLSSLDIHYTGNIETITGAEFDNTLKQITGVFTNESFFEIKLNDETIKK